MIPDDTTQSEAEASESPNDASKSPAQAVAAIFDTLQPYDETTRQRILASVLTLLGMTTAPSTTTSTGTSRRPLSPAELIQAKEPATNSQRIIVFAYYREKYENLNYFARDDLKGYFSKAKLVIPANYDRDFTDALKQGWIYENGDESYLTSKGLEVVEAGFGGKAAPRGRSVKTKSSKTNKKNNATSQ